MRNLSIGLILLLLVNTLQAAEKKPTIANYEDVLTYHVKASENVSRPDFYKNLSFKKKGSEAEVKFSSITEFEKNLFYIYQAEAISNRLKLLNTAWSDELAAFDRIEAINILDVEPKKSPNAPTKKELLSFLDRLETLRKQHALRFESLTQQVFTKFSKEIPEKDRENYSKELQDWNDEEKLITRQKADK